LDVAIHRTAAIKAGGASLFLLAALALLPSGCATRKTARQPAGPPQPYLRVQRAPDSTLSLQVAIREFTAPQKRWPKIFLVGVTHLGETNYYHTLQQRLDRCALVLYEGIGDVPRDAAALKEESRQSSLPARLARALGLALQLEVIRYDRPHFKNSDLTTEQLWEAMRRDASLRPSPSSLPGLPLRLAGAVERPGGSVGEGLEEMVDILEGNSFAGVLAHTMVQFIAASPRLQATVKAALIETMGGIDGDVTEAKYVPEDWQALMHFLIKERNTIVLNDVRRLIHEKRPPPTVAIFYGAGHMHDLEARLREEVGYQPVREEWLTAMSLNTRAAGVSELELSWIRSLIEAQRLPRKSP
jgi:hypothetical protein